MLFIKHNLLLNDCQYIYLRNWFALVLCNLSYYYNYSNDLMLVPDENISYKNHCVFFVRHSLYDLFPLDKKYKDILNADNDFQTMIDEIPLLNEYVFILLNNNAFNNKKNFKFNFELDTINNISTMFDTNNVATNDQFIFIEYRYLKLNEFKDYIFGVDF
jgi:hypothetical protein